MKERCLYWQPGAAAVHGHPALRWRVLGAFLAVLEEQQSALPPPSFPGSPWPQREFVTRKENNWTWGSSISPFSALQIWNVGFQSCSSLQLLNIYQGCDSQLSLDVLAAHRGRQLLPGGADETHTENGISPGLQEIQGQIKNLGQKNRVRSFWESWEHNTSFLIWIWGQVLQQVKLPMF